MEQSTLALRRMFLPSTTLFRMPGPDAQEAAYVLMIELNFRRWLFRTGNNFGVCVQANYFAECHSIVCMTMRCFPWGQGFQAVKRSLACGYNKAVNCQTRFHSKSTGVCPSSSAASPAVSTGHRLLIRPLMVGSWRTYG